MEYDIVSIKGKYRGMGRSLLATDLLANKESKKKFDYLLNLYEKYISCMEEPISKEKLEFMIQYHKILMEYNIPCEIIVYDITPINNVYGYSLEWLGIDITHEMCESLLEGSISTEVHSFLNENGLCENQEDVLKVIPFQNPGSGKWEPCYIYKLEEA